MGSGEIFDTFTIQISTTLPPAEAPEPTTLALLGGALLVLGITRLGRGRMVR